MQVRIFTKSTVAERNNNKGMEKLNNLNPDELGLNENDFRMIEKFKTTTPGGN